MTPIYIDSEFKCHVINPDGTFREVVLSESARDFFAGKCTEFIEGYRLKPNNETWVREDGKVFSGSEMVTPWRDYAELDNAQREYERAKLAQYEQELPQAYLDGVNSI